MTSSPDAPQANAERALWLSTIAFTICFAVWTIFAIIGVKIKQDLGLTETQFGLMVGMPILTGSLVRILLGVWTPRYGGRLVYTLTMLAAALATFLLTYAHTYAQTLIAALGVGLAGGSFAVGVAYVSPFFPAEKQGTALGIFGAGNVGAAVTKFVAPFVLVAFGWHAVAEIWAAVLAVMAVVFWFSTDNDPEFLAQVGRPAAQVLGAGVCAAEEHAGLAFRTLLFLRLRRVRRAVALAAALSDRRLWLQHRGGRDACRVLLDPGQPVPRLWRIPVGPEGRADRDVCHVHGGRGCDGDPVLSRRADRVHRHPVRAWLRDEPRQGRGLQAHPRLLPARGRGGRRRRRHDRGSRRLRDADRFRLAQGHNGRLAELLRAPLRDHRGLGDLDARSDPTECSRNGLGRRHSLNLDPDPGRTPSIAFRRQIMTLDQIELVQTSFAKIVPISDTATSLFYGRLFEIAPELKPLFKSDMRGQGRKLMTTLGAVVSGLRNLDAILPIAKALALKHVTYGVRPEHYKPVGEALIWTLERGLGDDFTPTARTAWTVAYETLSSAMIANAYGEVAA
jgi:hemoglobin-like flavoprotein